MESRMMIDIWNHGWKDRQMESRMEDGQMESRMEDRQMESRMDDGQMESWKDRQMEYKDGRIDRWNQGWKIDRWNQDERQIDGIMDYRQRIRDEMKMEDG